LSWSSSSSQRSASGGCAAFARGRLEHELAALEAEATQRHWTGTQDGVAFAREPGEAVLVGVEIGDRGELGAHRVLVGHGVVRLADHHRLAVGRA